jgi:L-lactate dehydrogenase (cytochrome)
MTRKRGPLNFEDMRLLARRRLPKGVFEYIDRGTEDELALAQNRQSLDAVRLVPFALRDVSNRSLTTSLFGTAQQSPLVIAPTAMAGLVWRQGEVELARAAAAAGIPFCVATQSITPIETIAETGARLWFQLYFWENRDLSFRLVERARAAGVEVLVVTIDTPVAANREFNTVNGFGLPFKPSIRALVDIGCHPAWLGRVILPSLFKGQLPTFAHYPSDQRLDISRAQGAGAARLADSLSWADIVRLREIWPGKLVLKGILREEDAVEAAELGVDGIVVSNHGGRNLDSAVPAAKVLASIAAAVGDRLTVLADGSVRRGSDVVKLLALGASGVMIGRAALYGTACDGRAGATRMLDILGSEIDRTMALLGVREISEIGPDLIYRERNPSQPGQDGMSPANRRRAQFTTLERRKSE